MKKAALITGITGQDGSFLAEFLIEKGYEVHGLLRRSSSFNTGRIEHLYLDEWVRDMKRERLVNLHWADMTDSSSLIRIIGEVTAEKVKLVQDADAIFREEMANAGFDKTANQYFAALSNMRSVGCMGDERTYDYACVLRAVTTTDFMTAEAAELPWSLINKVTSRIVNEVKGINRVMYDCTGKPPATIELE